MIPGVPGGFCGVEPLGGPLEGVPVAPVYREPGPNLEMKTLDGGVGRVKNMMTWSTTLSVITRQIASGTQQPVRQFCTDLLSNMVF